MSRNRGDICTNHFAQFANAALLLFELFGNKQARLMGHGLEQTA
jgi:hypothetical protein